MKRSAIALLLISTLFVLMFSQAIAQDQNIAVYAHPVSFPDLDPSSGNSNENVVMTNAYDHSGSGWKAF